MTTDTRVARTEPDSGAHTLEQVVIVGDLAKLTPADRVMYYQETCRSLGLNPLTKPFQYIVLNGRLTLYATRTATDQLRAIKGISIDRIEQAEVAEIYTATVYGHDQSGRTDSDTGAVSITGLKGENRANAIMKAITKGKRRLTLSLAGLGWLDESEVGSIPSARPVDVDQETGEIHELAPITDVIAATTARIRSGAGGAEPSAGFAKSGAVSAPSPTAGQDEDQAAGTAPRPVESGRDDTRMNAPEVARSTSAGEFGERARPSSAGARPSTPGRSSGSDEASHPSDGASEPAPDTDARCMEFSPVHGRCVADFAHSGPHVDDKGETW
jgi:hypothetical protein